MNPIIKRELSKLLSKKIIFTWIVLIILNLDTRINESLSYQQFIVEALSNHYYIIYFMIPMFLLIFVSSKEDDIGFVLIRYKNYWNYYKSKICAYGIFSIIFVLSQSLIVLIMSIGLKNDNSFNNISSTVYEVLYFYSNKFSNPVEVAICMTIYMTLGIFMTSLIIFTSNNYLGKNISIKVIIFIYIMSFISIKIDSLRSISFLYISTYIIFHHGFIFGFGFIQNLVIEIIFILMMLKMNKHIRIKDRILNKSYNINYSLKERKGKNKGIYMYHRQSLINKHSTSCMIFILIVMSVWKLISTDGIYHINEYIIHTFAGTAIGELKPLIVLEMLVFNLAPIYLLSVFIEKECNDRSLFFNIRLKTSRAWLKSIISASSKLIFIYSVLNIIIPIMIGVINGFEFNNSTYKLLIIVFIIKLLSITFEFLTLFLIYIFTNNITKSFFGLIILNVISILPFDYSYYSPFGISSLKRYEFILSGHGMDYGLSFSCVILELIIFIIMTGIYLISKHKKLLIK